MSRGLRPGKGAQAELSDALRAARKPNFAARLLLELGTGLRPRPGSGARLAPPPDPSRLSCPVHSRRLTAENTCPAPGVPPRSRSCARLAALVHLAERGCVGHWLGMLPPPHERAAAAGCGCAVCEAVRPLAAGADVRSTIAELFPDTAEPCE